MLLGKGWVRNNTVGLRARGHELDDLHQEANIAAYKLPHRPEIAARKRLASLGRGRRYLGNELHGHGHVRTYTTDEIGWKLLDERTATVDERDTQIAVREAVKRLPEDLRRIVWLRFYEELTWRDIARKLGVSTDVPRHAWDNEIAPKLREALA